MNETENTACLLIYCADQPGLVAALSTFLYKHNANIVHADQHQDRMQNLFFMRVEWELEHFKLSEQACRAEFEDMAQRLALNWNLSWPAARPKVALFVSHHLHCLADLLHRHEAGELPCEIPLVISNHRDAEKLVRFHGLEFHHLPVNKENKCAVEQEQLSLLQIHNIDLVILARYMQVLSDGFVANYPNKIINVHHSFLPAFKGAQPYAQAHERGVKIIGATSHYVTADLDEGPIIEQDVVRVSHRDQPKDLSVKGKDLERTVLSRAVKWHLQQRILVYGHKTVIFD